MPTFLYTARTPKGEKVDGRVDANDRRAALVLIGRLGHVPVSVREVSGAAEAPAARKGAPAARKGAPAARKGAPAEVAPVDRKAASAGARREKMKTRELLLFTTELSDLLASGMTLGNALNSLASRGTGRPIDRIVTDLRDEILRGSSLSDALAKHPATFSTLYVSMIKAGEAGASMTDVLRRLVDHFERVQEVRDKVVMAMVYPLIVLVMGIGTLTFSMVYVIPKFKMVFQQLGQALPLPTRILIGMSEASVRYGWLIVIAVIFLTVMARRAIQTDQGRLWWDGFKLKLPLIRGIVAAGTYANFARTLGTLLTNGVPVLEALRIVERTVGNTVVGREIANARERVTDGTTVSGPLAAGKIFPVTMTDMLAVGEQTGDVPGALSHIARRYENEVNRHVKIFTTALEPILIVVIAIMVGFVAVSILMAVFNLTNGLNV